MVDKGISRKGISSMKDSPEEEIIEDWDYRKEVRIDPCECNQDCGNYILSIKGKYAHIKNALPDEFLDVCTLDADAIYDLYRNCEKILDHLVFREKLEETIKKHP